MEDESFPLYNLRTDSHRSQSTSLSDQKLLSDRKALHRLSPLLENQTQPQITTPTDQIVCRELAETMLHCFQPSKESERGDPQKDMEPVSPSELYRRFQVFRNTLDDSERRIRNLETILRTSRARRKEASHNVTLICADATDISDIDNSSVEPLNHDILQYARGKAEFPEAEGQFRLQAKDDRLHKYFSELDSLLNNCNSSFTEL